LPEVLLPQPQKEGAMSNTFRQVQIRRSQQLLKFAQLGQPVLVKSAAWLILRKECGGFFGFLRWLLHGVWLTVKIRAQVNWRIYVRGMDPEDDATWQ
jgi:hypothetical protein